MIDLPAAMPAAVYRRPGEVVVEERPVPRAGPGEVLVEVEHCGICGTDIHLLVEDCGSAGLVAGHEFDRPHRRAGGRCRGWEVGQPVVGGTSPVRAVPPLPGGQALPVREPGLDRRGQP